MNILMLGNGFDLYHNLPTAYINFIHIIEQYHKEYSDSIPMNILRIIEDKYLLNSDKSIKNAYDAYKDIYKEISITQEEHKQIVALAKNYWFKYFQSCCPHPLTWIDFEKEIQNVVNSFDFFFKNVDIKNENTLCFWLPGSEKQKYLISKFNFFYVAGISEAFEDDGSTIGYKYINRAFKKQDPVGSDIYVPNKEKIVEYLFRQLLELSEGLKLYLDLFVKRLIEDEAFNSCVELNELFNGFNAVVNFNYTNTHELLYNNLDKTIYAHIHGELDSSIILGVNSNKYDETHNLDTTFLKFKKYYQRVLYKTENNFMAIKNRIIRNKELFKEKSQIIVFGHSLDKTDEDIIIELFELVDKITVYCYDWNALNQAINNLISIYGRTEFDNIRYYKNLDFILLNE